MDIAQYLIQERKIESKMEGVQRFCDQLTSFLLNIASRMCLERTRRPEQLFVSIMMNILMIILLTLSRERYHSCHYDSYITTDLGLDWLKIVSRMVPLEVLEGHTSKGRLGFDPCGCQVIS